MTKEEFKSLLDIPSFAVLDYRCYGCADHKFVNELGYEVREGGDCSCYCTGLKGISFSSWGDWGSIFVDTLDDVSKDICKQMIDNDIITFFRIR